MKEPTGKLKFAYQTIANMELIITDLKCEAKLAEYNLVYILKHNKKLLLPPTLKFKDESL